MAGMDHGSAHTRTRRLRARRRGRQRGQRLRSEPRSCATSTAARSSQLPDGRTLREWHLVAVDKEIEIAPGVHFAAWTYNGRMPGPDAALHRGRQLRIRFTNGSAHPHTIHFHGIHPVAMDGVPGARRGDRRRADRARPVVRLRVRRRAVRPAPLPLPRHPARRAHRQGPLRHVHRRPEGGARAEADELVMVMNGVRHELRPRQRGLRGQHDRLRLPGQADQGQARRARADLPRQRARVRPDQLVPPARATSSTTSRPARCSQPSEYTDTVMPGARGSAASSSCASRTPASTCSTPTRPSSPSSAGWASSRSRTDGGRGQPARDAARARLWLLGLVPLALIGRRSS